jgi:23S rRNA A1618 N6-methylase RlmF
MTKEERIAYQRNKRIENQNAYTKRYEKSVGGYLMRMYRNMKSRVTGVQKQKHHLYVGKTLISKEEFYEWAMCSPMFHVLWPAYVASGYEQKLAPTVDRKDSGCGYELDNMEWVTHSVNSSRGAKARHAVQL